MRRAVSRAHIDEVQKLIDRAECAEIQLAEAVADRADALRQLSEWQGRVARLGPALRAAGALIAQLELTNTHENHRLLCEFNAMLERAAP